MNDPCDLAHDETIRAAQAFRQAAEWAAVARRDRAEFEASDYLGEYYEWQAEN